MSYESTVNHDTSRCPLLRLSRFPLTRPPSRPASWLRELPVIQVRVEGARGPELRGCPPRRGVADPTGFPMHSGKFNIQAATRLSERSSIAKPPKTFPGARFIRRIAASQFSCNPPRTTGAFLRLDEAPRTFSPLRHQRFQVAFSELPVVQPRIEAAAEGTSALIPSSTGAVSYLAGSSFTRR